MRAPGISLKFELGDLEQVLRGAADLASAMVSFGFETEEAERRAPWFFSASWFMRLTVSEFLVT